MVASRAVSSERADILAGQDPFGKVRLVRADDLGDVELVLDVGRRLALGHEEGTEALMRGRVDAHGPHERVVDLPAFERLHETSGTQGLSVGPP